jgi:putative component of membrane protein insertase Oxa1/YidC/SpoIIIJ protein YidD
VLEERTFLFVENLSAMPSVRTFLILLCLCASLPLHAQESGSDREDRRSYLGSVSQLALDFYQQLLSPVRSPASHCQFEPSCSEFAKQAVAEYGVLRGGLLAADRFLRCGAFASPHTYPFDGKHFVDPPVKNYIVGNGGIWRLGLEGHLPSLPDRPQMDIPKFLRVAYSLYKEEEFDYSVLELRRMQIEDSSFANYANTLIAIDQLRSKSIKKARAAIDRTDIATLDSMRRFSTFLVDFLIADAADLDAWNAARIAAKHDSSSLIRRLEVYAFAKNEQYGEAADLATAFQSRDFVYQVAKSESRSRTVAAVLSTLLPGAGYAYAGRYGEAVSALTFNTLLGWGIYSLFKNHNTGSGILLSTLTLPFYVGNIMGSANAVAAENARSKAIALGSLRRSLQLDFYFSTDFLDQCWY